MHNSAHHSSRYMRFSIALMATPSPSAVLKCDEPVKRNFNWNKDFKHCTVGVNMSRVSRPENPRSNRKKRNSAGRLWISTSSSWSEKFWHPVSESCTIFLPTSAFTALARSSVHLPWRTNPYQLDKAKCEARASSTRWKLGSPVGYDCKSSKSHVPRRERAMLFRIRTLSIFCVAWASLSCPTFTCVLVRFPKTWNKQYCTIVDIVYCLILYIEGQFSKNYIYSSGGYKQKKTADWAASLKHIHLGNLS